VYKWESQMRLIIEAICYQGESAYLLHLEDTGNPLFHFSCVIQESHYYKLQREQDIVIDFGGFPKELLAILGKCKKTAGKPGKLFCKFSICRGDAAQCGLGTIGGDDRSPHVDEANGLRRFVPKFGSMEVFEAGKFKNVLQFRLEFHELDDLSVKNKLINDLDQLREETDKVQKVAKENDKLAKDKDKEIQALIKILKDNKLESKIPVSGTKPLPNTKPTPPITKPANSPSKPPGTIPPKPTTSPTKPLGTTTNPTPLSKPATGTLPKPGGSTLIKPGTSTLTKPTPGVPAKPTPGVPAKPTPGAPAKPISGAPANTGIASKPAAGKEINPFTRSKDPNVKPTYQYDSKDGFHLFQRDTSPSHRNAPMYYHEKPLHHELEGEVVHLRNEVAQLDKELSVTFALKDHLQ
jgi:ribosomal protein L15